MPNSNKASPSQIKDRVKSQHLVTSLKIENLACQCLVEPKVRILHRHFQSPFDESDLIGFNKNQLILTEARFKRIAESFNDKKQQQLLGGAQYALFVNPEYENLACRFDVFAVTLVNHEPSLEWNQNAFC